MVCTGCSGLAPPMTGMTGWLCAALSVAFLGMRISSPTPSAFRTSNSRWAPNATLREQHAHQTTNDMEHDFKMETDTQPKRTIRARARRRRIAPAPQARAVQ